MIHKILSLFELRQFIDVKEEWDYDDDCLLCQMMKQADEGGKIPTLSEIKAAFLKVKQQGGVVGGEWFDSEKK